MIIYFFSKAGEKFKQNLTIRTSESPSQASFIRSILLGTYILQTSFVTSLRNQIEWELGMPTHICLVFDFQPMKLNLSNTKPHKKSLQFFILLSGQEFRVQIARFLIPYIFITCWLTKPFRKMGALVQNYGCAYILNPT